MRLTGVERYFDAAEIIVSKTDKQGRITYANAVFQTVSGYTERELIGKPHNIVRHPDMPGCVFKLLWTKLTAGEEVFAYVVNTARNGDHYWVFAHVTPSISESGEIVGYHSSRRLPERSAVAKVAEIYRALRGVESASASRQDGVNASLATMQSLLADKGVSYEEFVFTL